MLLERHAGGQVRKRLEVERAHRLSSGQFKPFYEIAAELYDEFPTGGEVQSQIRERFGVEISEKTASLWINRGLQARRAQIEAQLQDRAGAEDALSVA